jgi:hypothetical protein
VTWEVLADVGAVRFVGLPSGKIPWLVSEDAVGDPMGLDGTLLVLPAAGVDADVLDRAEALGAGSTPVAVAIPNDGHGDLSAAADRGVLVLRCPDRVGELDQSIESKLLTARISRS